MAGGCTYLRDALNTAFSCTEPLGVLLAKVALECANDANASAAHARHAFASRCVNEIKNMHARYALISSLVHEDSKGDE